MSGSRQQLDKISVSDIQLMSLHGSVFSTIVSAHQSVGKTFFYPWTGRSEHLGHQTSFLSAVGKLGSDAGR